MSKYQLPNSWLLAHQILFCRSVPRGPLRFLNPDRQYIPYLSELLASIDRLGLVSIICLERLRELAQYHLLDQTSSIGFGALLSGWYDFSNQHPENLSLDTILDQVGKTMEWFRKIKHYANANFTLTQFCVWYHFFVMLNTEVSHLRHLYLELQMLSPLLGSKESVKLNPTEVSSQGLPSLLLKRCLTDGD